MELKLTESKYTVISRESGKYLAVRILSEHNNLYDALDAMFEAMNEEPKERTNREVEELKKNGIDAVTLEEAIKDMTPEQLESFLEERNRKFINPILNKNIEELKQLKQKRNRAEIRRIK